MINQKNGYFGIRSFFALSQPVEFDTMEAEGEIMKKISSALLAALLLLATVFTGAPTALAAGVSVNATTVTVYFLNQEFREKISQPAAYPASFQLKVNGADKATYRVTAGESATVSSTGLAVPDWWSRCAPGTTGTAMWAALHLPRARRRTG